MKTVGITVKGRVQGVFFRKYTVEAALKFGVGGYVCNLRDGNVYIVASGDDDSIGTMIEWCHEGSPQSKVEEVIVESLEVKNYDNFGIRYSA